MFLAFILSFKVEFQAAEQSSLNSNVMLKSGRGRT